MAVPAVSVLGLVAAAVSSTLTGAAGGAVEVACCSGHSAMTGGAAVAAAAALCSAVPGHRPKSRWAAPGFGRSPSCLGGEMNPQIHCFSELQRLL